MSAGDPFLQLFMSDFIPKNLKNVSHMFEGLAVWMVSELPRGDDRAEALLLLHEAMDRAMHAKLRG